VKRAGLVLVVIVLFGSACAVEDTLPAPYCEGAGSALIEAQSVPTAEIIPCITELPAGWEVESVDINQERTIVTLDSDRAGDNAAVFHYERSCDIGDAVSVPSDDDRIERFEDLERIEPGYRARSYSRFAGGCWWWRFNFVPGASATIAVQVSGSIDWLSRDDLNATIAETFVDEDL